MEIILVLLVLVAAALLKSHLSWSTVRRILLKALPYEEPSPHLVRFLYLRMRIYEAFHRVATQRGDLETFFKLVGEAMKAALEADAYSVLLTPTDGRWYFIAWDEKYDKRDLDAIAPLMSEMSGAKTVHDTGEVREMRNTSRFREWRYVQELADLKNIGGETRAWIGIPVKAGGRVIAVISMDWFEPRRYGRWAVELAKMVSEDVSTAAEGMREIIDLMTRSDYDPIFGVPGRRALEEDFSRISERGERMGLIVVRLEGVERIREVYGQSVRNEALKMAAGRIRNAIPSDARMYSVSQDTLVVLIPNPSHTALASRQRRILSEFLRVFSIQKDGKNVFVKINASVGFSVFPDEGGDLSGLVEIALRRGVSH